MMDLRFDYLKILKIAEEAKRTKKLELQVLSEITGFIFTDSDIFAAFVREGAGLKDNKEANQLISDTMLEGVDILDIQLGIIKDLIAINLYKKDLQKILDVMEKGPVVEQ